MKRRSLGAARVAFKRPACRFPTGSGRAGCFSQRVTFRWGTSSPVTLSTHLLHELHQGQSGLDTGRSVDDMTSPYVGLMVARDGGGLTLGRGHSRGPVKDIHMAQVTVTQSNQSCP